MFVIFSTSILIYENSINNQLFAQYCHMAILAIFSVWSDEANIFCKKCWLGKVKFWNQPMNDILRQFSTDSGSDLLAIPPKIADSANNSTPWGIARSSYNFSPLGTVHTSSMHIIKLCRRLKAVSPSNNKKEATYAASFSLIIV